MGKVVKLMLVSGEVNSNKFYHMTDNDNGTFSVEYGRVGSTAQKASYPISQWSKKYNEKVKKGYKDNTELFIVEDATITSDSDNSSTTTFASTRSSGVVELVNKLQGWANKSVSENYTVSAKDVTQKQIDKAQEVLNSLVSFNLDQNTIKEFNDLLLNFYTIVPRKMKNVKSHLIDIDDDLTERKNKIITEEQETLDVMVGQVKLNEDTKSDSNTDDKAVVVKDLIEASGLNIEEVTDTKIIDMVKGMMQNNAHKFKKLYSVVNYNTQKRFSDFVNDSSDKKTELFWHGSRNENWWSIMTSGLLIRPTNAVHTGSMFGNSCYFANRCQKSIGYTSLRNSYWASGNSNEAVLALYDVHVGNQKHIYKHTSDCYTLNYDRIKKEGFDSVYAHGGIDLINDEFMVYHTHQSTIKYLLIIED